jgi:hypothetical protein
MPTMGTPGPAPGILPAAAPPLMAGPVPAMTVSGGGLAAAGAAALPSLPEMPVNLRDP